MMLQFLGMEHVQKMTRSVIEMSQAGFDKFLHLRGIADADAFMLAPFHLQKITTLRPIIDRPLVIWIPKHSPQGLTHAVREWMGPGI
jgi:hypothetical protein